jgi:hypothetical protein
MISTHSNNEISPRQFKQINFELQTAYLNKINLSITVRKILKATLLSVHSQLN